ncbi:MAG: site-specific integrase [Candidatus Bathyarchaeia archaeon]|jgi:integrase
MGKTVPSYRIALEFEIERWKSFRNTLQSEEEIDQLIAGAGKKVATMLKIMKETGMRLGECLSLKWTCIDFQKEIVTLTTAEKHSLPRLFNVSHALISMLQNLPKQNDKVFGIMNTDSAGRCLRDTRKKVAHKLANPRIGKIHYHKKPDMDYVRRRLGHKSILNTQIYVNMEQVMFATKSDEYLVKTAMTAAEACKLIEVGFEYVTEVEGVKIFRKRK